MLAISTVFGCWFGFHTSVSASEAVSSIFSMFCSFNLNVSNLDQDLPGPTSLECWPRIQALLRGDTDTNHQNDVGENNPQYYGASENQRVIVDPFFSEPVWLLPCRAAMIAARMGRLLVRSASSVGMLSPSCRMAIARAGRTSRLGHDDNAHTGFHPSV